MASIPIHNEDDNPSDRDDIVHPTNHSIPIPIHYPNEPMNNGAVHNNNHHDEMRHALRRVDNNYDATKHHPNPPPNADEPPHEQLA